MTERTIGLIAAMSEEITPLLRDIGPYSKEAAEGFSLCRFHMGGGQVCLIESGMGIKRAASATRALIAAANPCIIVNFGFAGAVSAGLAVGDIVVAERLLSIREEVLIEQRGVSKELAGSLTGMLGESCRGKGFQVYPGTFVTSEQIIDKGKVSRLLPAEAVNAVLEMESSAVARVAAGGNVPLVAVRAISDGSEEDLGFTIDEFTDREMQIRIWKVFLTIARKPWIVSQLLRLARNSRLAGENLAWVVRETIKGLP